MAWIQICPEGGNEVIWVARTWDRVRSKVLIILIWKKGKISVTAQKDAVLWIFVEVKGFWKINFPEVIKTKTFRSQIDCPGDETNVIKLIITIRRQLIRKLRDQSQERKIKFN